MPIETAFRRQYAVVWFRKGFDADGEPTVAPPIQLRVRWTKGLQELPDPDGKVVLSHGMVTVDRPVPFNSVLWEGRLADWQLLDQNAPQVLMEVIRTTTTPGLNGRRFRRVLYLGFYKSKLPQVVG